MLQLKNLDLIMQWKNLQAYKLKQVRSTFPDPHHVHAIGKAVAVAKIRHHFIKVYIILGSSMGIMNDETGGCLTGSGAVHSGGKGSRMSVRAGRRGSGRNVRDPFYTHHVQHAS